MPVSAEVLYSTLEEFMLRLMNSAESDGMDALVELDLSLSQARTLFTLAKHGEPMPIHAIAAALGLSDAATGRNVEQLLKLDIVERRESPDDRRVKLVSLTTAGEKLITQHLDSKLESMKAFAAALPQDHRDALHRALSDILAGDNGRRPTDQEIRL